MLSETSKGHLQPQNTTDGAEGRLGAVATAQWGVFSRKQAVEAGLSARTATRRAALGVWSRLLPGVYRNAGTPESWHQQFVAACLWGGEDALISHLSAARLHGLEGIPSVKRGGRSTSPWSPIMFAVPPAWSHTEAERSNRPTGAQETASPSRVSHER